VEFEIEVRDRTLVCHITRQALEDYFWLQRQASEDRVLRTFFDGRKRIVATAERKALRSSATTLELSSHDFAG
jgi:hypothetical protein